MKKLITHPRLRNSILYTWLVSYIACTLLPFVTLVLVHTRYDSMLKNTVNEMNSYVSENIANNAQEILKTIHRLYMEVSTNNNFNAILELENLEAFYDKKDYWEALEIVQRNNLYLSNIDFFYVYFERSDTVMCSVGLYDSKSFYQIYLEPAGVGYEQWKNSLKLRYAKHSMVTGDGVSEVTSYNTPIRASSNAVVATQVSKSRFLNGLDLINDEFLCDTYIFDKDGGLIFSNTNDEISDYGTFSEQIEADKSKIMTVFDVATENTGVKLITVADKKIIFSDIEKVRNLTVILMLICVVMLCISIPLMLKRNYLPVRKIMDEFGIDRARQNEFAQIHHYIREIIHGSEMLGNERDEYYEEIKKFVISSLLSQGGNGELFEKKLKGRDNVFPNEKFIVTVFDTGNTILLFSDEYDMSEHEKEMYFTFIIENVMNELLNTNGDTAYVVTAEKNSVALINTSHSTVDEIFHKIEYGANFINENFQTQLTFAVSDLHSAVEEVHEAYREAIKGINHKKYFAFSGAVKYSEISNIRAEKNNFIYFESRNEQLLINSIKSGNYYKSEEIIEEIFSHLYRMESSAYDYVKCIMMDMAAAVLKMQTEYNPENVSYTAENIITLSNNIHEMKTFLLEVVRELCSIRISNQNSSRSLIEAVKEYVESNYSDSNLNVAAVANRFNLVPTYIAAIFKENEGVLLGDYIHKIRLEKAKSLIEERKYTMADISAMCGFAHVRTFNRVFKKYEGVTPREYLK